MLDDAAKDMAKKYPNQKFIPVGVDLSSPTGEPLQKLYEATKDLDIQIVFSNAGYIKTGFFTANSLEDQLKNYHCNATSAVHLGHHYIKNIQTKRLRGCFVVTSSPASLMPCPFSAMYGATKSFLTEYAASLASEVRCDGIDVMAMNPSPVKSNFYAGAHAIDMLEMFKKTGVSPYVIADHMLANVGRTVICDQGYYSLATRCLLKVS